MSENSPDLEDDPGTYESGLPGFLGTIDEIIAKVEAFMLAAGVILTGGGALLQNLDQLGEEVLGLPVRIGVPQDIIAPESVQSPECATAVGLLRFATDQASGSPGERIVAPVQGGKSIIDKIAGLFSFL